MTGGNRPLLRENLAGSPPCKTPIFDLFSPVAASAVTPSEKSSIKTNRKSTMRFPMSLKWTSYVVPNPQRGSKPQNDRFQCKIALRLRKVCYEKSLCENCHRQSCKAFTGLTICAKMIGGGHLLKRKCCIK